MAQSSALYNAFRKGEAGAFSRSAAASASLYSPSFAAARVAAYGPLGELEAAQKAVKELLAVNPPFATTGREFYGKSSQQNWPSV